MSTHPQHLYEFGPFRLDKAERLLLRDGEPVPLTPKAFETLVALVERSGHLVEKDELMKVVWADAFVEESNLTNNVYALRKLLGQGENGRSYIETVPKRGYRFTAPGKELPSERLVVEKRTLTRVVTEETLADDPRQKSLIGGREALALESAPAHADRKPKWPWLLTPLLVVSLGIAGFFVYRAFSSQSGPQIGSIAVLPFKNESGNPDVEYLSDGVTESLINRLSQLLQLKVIARNSSFEYKGKEINPQEVSQALGVEAILIGRVTQRDDSLVVSVELMNTRDKTQLWGERYTRKLTDVQTVQEEIALTISEKLRLRLSSTQQQRESRRGTENTEAYKAYLKGRYYWNRARAAGYEKSLGYFQQAIDLDPTYALPHVGLADYYGFASAQGLLPPDENWPKTETEANQAFALDNTLAEAYNPLAAVKLYYHRDWPAAERYFRRGIELNANSAELHHHYATCLYLFGRNEEALAEIRRAVELDPLSLRYNMNWGRLLYSMRQYDNAIDQLHKALELEPNFAQSHEWLGYAYEQKGMQKEAIAEWATALKLNQKDEQAASLEQTYAVAGFESAVRSLARQRLKQAEERSKRGEYVPAAEQVIAYIRVGDKEQALAWLDKAVHERNRFALEFKINPLYDELRDEPRFQASLRLVGISQ